MNRNEAFGTSARSLRTILRKAKEKRKAICAVNVNDLTDLLAAIDCATELAIPLIMNVSSRSIEFAGLERLWNILGQEKGRYRNQIFTGLDHVKDYDLARKAMQLGFDTVMADGSDLALKDNIKWVMRLKTLDPGAVLEAQVGVIPDSRDRTLTPVSTDLGDARLLVHETGVDLLSVSFGNRHDYFLEGEHCALDLTGPSCLARELDRTALVIHGADTIPSEDLAACVQAGFTKINLGPCYREAYLAALRSANLQGAKDPREVTRDIRVRLTSFLGERLSGLGESLYRMPSAV